MSTYLLEATISSPVNYIIKKDGEELCSFSQEHVAERVLKTLQDMKLELQTYKELWESMAYYFDDDITSLYDLDDKDFRALKRLSKGLMD